MDNRRFKLRDSYIAKIGSNQNCVRWCFAWKTDRRRIGQNHERSVRWRCLCRYILANSY